MRDFDGRVPSNLGAFLLSFRGALRMQECQPTLQLEVIGWRPKRMDLHSKLNLLKYISTLLRYLYLVVVALESIQNNHPNLSWNPLEQEE